MLETNLSRPGHKMHVSLSRLQGSEGNVGRLWSADERIKSRKE